jgi:hypothetical protein
VCQQDNASRGRGELSVEKFAQLCTVVVDVLERVVFKAEDRMSGRYERDQLSEMDQTARRRAVHPDDGTDERAVTSLSDLRVLIDEAA